MQRTSVGYATIDLERRVEGKLLRDRLHCPNVLVRSAARDCILNMWGTPTAPVTMLRFWPWRLPPQWDGGASGVLVKGVIFVGTDLANFCYPGGTQDSDSSPIQVTTTDPRRFRMFQNTVGSSTAARTPRTVGALILDNNLLGISITEGSPVAFVATDLPITTIGIPWLHPVTGAGATLAAGLAYATGAPSWSYLHSGGMLRIESGPDKGVYFLHHYDYTNNRSWFMNMDGTLFVAQGTGAIAAGYCAPRSAQMNETGVVPNGKGSIAFGGRFDPGENRTTYMIRLRFEKSGSPSPVDPNQQGTYWFTLKPWLHGNGRDSAADYTRYDLGQVANSRVGFGNGSGNSGSIANNTNIDAYGLGAVLDRANQRLWMVCADYATKGSIYWWRYKSPECFREVATYTGTPNDPIAGITLNGGVSFPRSIDIGSDNTVYVCCNNGWVAISPTLVATQVKRADIGLGSASLNTIAVDRSRARSGGANTITTTAGGGNLVATDAAFTQADFGRVIKITGGADAGTYKISVVTDGTHVTVTTPAGVAVSFTGQAATGTWQIGDRIYILCSDATTNAGKISYFESLAFGILHQTTVTMTNGADVNAGDLRYSMGVYACVDQRTGCLYWLGSLGTPQINRYDPSQVAPAGWSRRLRTDFTKANDVAQNSSNATTATGMADVGNFMCVGANPHASFRELWVGTDQGWLKLQLDNFAGSWGWYWGTGSEATPYQRPTGTPRPDGSFGMNPATWSSRTMRWVGFGVDGRVYGVAQKVTVESYLEFVIYNREADVWTTGIYSGTQAGYRAGSVGAGTLSTTFFLSPYGELWTHTPYHRATTENSGDCSLLAMFTTDIHYQYIGGVWTPKEAVRGALPGTTLSPGLQGKLLHTTLDDLIYGVKVKFTPQGGATPANSEFLGTLGCLGAARADGSWQTPGASSAYTQVFLGSGFVVGNVGDYIWVQSSTGNGASVGVYQITAYTNGNTVTVRKITAVNFNPGGDAGTLTYQVWSMGDSTVPGPENVTCIFANGIARDNTQDLNNIYFDWYLAKTLLSEQLESIKFCVEPPGPPGSPGVKTYYDYVNSTQAGWNPGRPQGLGLGTQLTSYATQLVDGLYKMPLIGMQACLDLRPSQALTWGGSQGRTAAGSGVSSMVLAVDLGVAAEVGSVVIRGWTAGNAGQYIYGTTYGTLAHLWNAPDGAAPTNASVSRTTGTGFSVGAAGGASSLTVASRTATLSAGDFLGSSLTTGTNGQTTAGGNRLTAAVGNFQASHLMCAVKITNGSDIGAYRIINVAGDGSYVDVRNLDQTAKTWAASASGLSWDVRDAVREEDIIYIAATSKYFSVERLLTTTTLEVRVTSDVTVTNANWSALKPTWNLVKRVSHSVMATPPDVVNNGTYFSPDGFEEGYNDSWKAVLDLSDLSSAQRSGRYWKFSMMPRGVGGVTLGSISYQGNSYYAPIFQGIEFYDLTGKLITTCKYNKLDTVDSQGTNFLAARGVRTDVIMAANSAAAHVAGANGLATVSGADLDTVTLAGGNIFLGWEIRRGVAGNTAGGLNATWNTDSPVAAGDPGATLHILSGPNAGYYRIATVPTTSSVTVTTQSGAAVTFAADAGPTPWTIHEAISTNFYFATGGKEAIITTISDDLKTLTLGDKSVVSGSGVAWEVRYRCSVYAPDGNGDLSQWGWQGPLNRNASLVDAHGYLSWHPEAVGNMPVRNDGATTLGTATFTGSYFTPDDVGRLLIIQSGVDKGRYEIASYVSDTQITVRDLDTGGVITFSGTLGSLPYKIQGERRFRISRYVTVLRN